MAGVRLSLWLSDNPGAYDCQECDARKRKARRCANNEGIKHGILVGPHEFYLPTKTLRPVQKIDNVKFYRCPIKLLTNRTWRIISTVNDVMDGDGRIYNLPFPGTWLEQPLWFRQAVRITRRERSEWQRKQIEKAKAAHG